MNWSEDYKGYRLRCRPVESEDGGFIARLMIERHGWYGTMVEEITVLPPVHATQADAALAAQITGHRWVDDLVKAE